MSLIVSRPTWVGVGAELVVSEVKADSAVGGAPLRVKGFGDRKRRYPPKRLFAYDAFTSRIASLAE